ncbi:pimeloyl-ACP methyl ester carboxylesterase [Pseudomonas fluvialis]|uniref:Pimeloyl-ACP methyl ester carboxylesterase n=1 Tax=Pseudomonas fluvialis TaxID=1793966 RepID=A0A7X0ET31_9PSED|nr:alpha/beta hydrolase [Pseudomonas fluvialis]MBB6342933.1 pimeloyl-ACP methyl ester carboxylesterase [Pseudomonas fluvialis]
MKSLFIQLPQGRLHYLDNRRSGPVVILLHGNSSAAAAFTEQFAELGEHYRLLAVDWPGHGQSDALPPADYSFSGYADVLVAFVRQMQLHDFALVGHSLGGHAAIEALPRLTGARGLILLGAPPFNSQLAAQLFHPEPTGGLVFQAALDNPQVTRLAKAFISQGNSTEHLLATLAHFIRATDPNVRSALGASLATGAFADEVALLATSGVPTLLLQGQNDAFINASSCTPQVFSPAPVQVVQLSDCGHCPHSEIPHLCNDLMHNFISALYENSPCKLL